MARYAIGFVLVFLLAGALLVSGFGLGFGGDRPVEERFRPVGPRAITAETPPDLLVSALDDAAALTPISYCWESEGAGVCADGVFPEPGEEPTFTAPVDLAFQIEWTLTVTVSSDALACGSYDLAFEPTGNVTLDDLGPLGEYVVVIFASHDQGDASWVIRVVNESDTDLPEGVSC